MEQWGSRWWLVRSRVVSVLYLQFSLVCSTEFYEYSLFCEWKNSLPVQRPHHTIARKHAHCLSINTTQLWICFCMTAHIDDNTRAAAAASGVHYVEWARLFVLQWNRPLAKSDHWLWVPFICRIVVFSLIVCTTPLVSHLSQVVPSTVQILCIISVLGCTDPIVCTKKNT